MVRLAPALILAVACTSTPVVPGGPGGGGDDVGLADASLGGPYPLVLAHGLFGFDQIGTIDYFYGVPDALRARGRTVFTPRVDAVQGTDVRAAQLDAALDDILAETGADKVVLIGHSQGGFDARWIAHRRPGDVAAVVTIATPHRGSVVADIALGVAPGIALEAFDAFVDLFGVSIEGSETSLEDCLETLSSAGTAAFNAAVPDAPGVAYYSIAGRSNMADSTHCPSSVPFLAAWDGELDPMATEIAAAAAIVTVASLPDKPANDGLMTVESATWGQFLGCIPADHVDEVCQIAGRPAGAGNDFDCVGFYVGLEQYLAEAGY